MGSDVTMCYVMRCDEQDHAIKSFCDEVIAAKRADVKKVRKTTPYEYNSVVMLAGC